MQGVLGSPYQQEFEIAKGTQDFTCTFKKVLNDNSTGQKYQFYDVYDKYYVHDNYDVELGSKIIKSLKFEDTSSTYSLSGKLPFDLETDEVKNLLYEMFVAHACDGCNSAPLTHYKNIDIYDDLVENYNYFSDKSDERIYIDMRRRVTLMNQKNQL